MGIATDPQVRHLIWILHLESMNISIICSNYKNSVVLLPLHIQYFTTHIVRLAFILNISVKLFEFILIIFVYKININIGVFRKMWEINDNILFCSEKLISFIECVAKNFFIELISDAGHIENVYKSFHIGSC